MNRQLSQMAGPEFLTYVSEAELANGNLINAQEYHRRALQWRDDQQALIDAQARLADAEARLRRVQAAMTERAP